MTPPKSQPNNAIKSVALIIFAMSLLAGINILAKALGQDHLGPALHPFQISFGRFAFAFTTLLIAASILRPKFTKPDMKLHLGRTTLGWAGVTLMFAAIAFIPLADATAISFLNPVFAMTVSYTHLTLPTTPYV